MGLYEGQFFADLDEGVRSSAAVVVPMLIDAIAPSSVIDLGCGTGTWLGAFRANGVKDVLGIDGDYVERSRLDIPPEQFQPADLNQPVRLSRTFDLATSFEVAEHLRPERSESFVADLVALAPVVCFSAAIPHQGGVDHINERWQDEWAAMFAKHSYRCADLIRSRVWDDERVEPWYAQNTLVYTRRDLVAEGDQLPMRLVHPRRYVQRMQQPHRRVLPPAELARETRRTLREALRYLREERFAR
jgi:SAM-dependent methyltransferase